MSREALIAQLEADGLLHRVDGRLRTTRRWQGAMMRAALRLNGLNEGSDEGADLRVPVAAALVEVYGVDTSDDTLVELIAILTPLEATL
ncbi:MAG: hypothetical protein HYV09_37750 [Deltaproteobacteria bacterium]|nr:hypothetical protein [Deltaproteobacteria bacterium]